MLFKLFTNFPRITLVRFIKVAFVVWSLSLMMGLYTDFAPLPSWAFHRSPGFILLLRKWPYSIPVFWLSVTAFFAYRQSKALERTDPPVEDSPILSQLSDEQVRRYRMSSEKRNKQDTGVLV